MFAAPISPDLSCREDQNWRDYLFESRGEISTSEPQGPESMEAHRCMAYTRVYRRMLALLKISHFSAGHVLGMIPDCRRQ